MEIGLHCFLHLSHTHTTYFGARISTNCGTFELCQYLWPQEQALDEKIAFIPILFD